MEEELLLASLVVLFLSLLSGSSLPEQPYTD
jgi:hypothetical protein